MKIMMLPILALTFLLSGCGDTTHFGPHDDIQVSTFGYYKITNERVSQVGDEIFGISPSSALSGNWSNVLPEGTEIYSIPGVKSLPQYPDSKYLLEAVAVEVKPGVYVKAVWNGTHAP